MDLSVEISGLRLRNPVLAAAGTFGYGIEYEDIVDLSHLGGIVSKGLSCEPMPGNPSPRLFETSAGMLNSIGLQNIGIPAFLETRLPRLRRLGATVIVNVYGDSVAEFVRAIGLLNEGEGIAAYELNASCPNTRAGGEFFASDAHLLAELTAAVKAVSRRPVWVKLSPNVTRIGELARAAESAGADALSLVNTFLGMAIDVHTRRPRFARRVAGLSGPAIKPLAVRQVYEACRAVRLPVIGIGGIASGEDAVEFLLAGASAVQVGTASFWDPRATERVIRDLEKFCAQRGIPAVRLLTGALEEPAPPEGSV